MHRFFLPNLQQLVLGADEAHHASTVLRLKVGDTVKVFDGRGHEAQAVISQISRQSVQLKLLTQSSTAPLPCRIAAGAIVIKDGKILLVRYPDSDGGSFLAAPGGGLEQDEAVPDAAVRETMEETGLQVAAGKVLCIEDLLCNHFKMCKI